MTGNIYLVGGSKGGVGKSFVSMATIDYFLDNKEKVLLIETDDNNPDVGKCYNKTIPAELIDLDTDEGWIDLVNLLDNYSDHIAIINTAARNIEGLTKYCRTLTVSLPELKRKLITFWVINRNLDCLELLKKYFDVINNSLIHVICNNIHGDLNKFEAYNTSNLKKQIESSGGKSVSFPVLANRVVDEIYNKRFTICQCIKEMPLGNRAELSRWKEEVKKIMEVIK